LLFLPERLRRSNPIFSGAADTTRLPYLIAFGRARPVSPVDE
jgi:hypothetical protein